MKFHVTASHVKQQNRKSVYAALFFTALSAGCIATVLSAKSISDMVFPVIGIFLFTPLILRIYRHIKGGAKLYPVIDLDEAAGKIAASHRDIVVTIDITQIKNLRLQHKSGRLASIIVTTSSGKVMRFEGYENMDALASALERFTPKERVTNARFYHR